MKLLKRLQFALKYNFDMEFIVYSFYDKSPMRFLKYEDAKRFSDIQIQSRPKIMLEVTKL